MIYTKVQAAAALMGITPTALLRKAGVSPTAGWKLVHNSRTGKPGGPPLTSIHTPALVAIAQVLGVSPIDLIEYRED